MKLFVTGGAGYIGSHCCKAFAARGWEVVVFDNLSRGWRDFVRWGRLIEGDVLDLDAVTAAMVETKPDAVVHFAALAYVGESVLEPARYYRVNTVGAMNVLDAMRATDVDRIVFSSTCATYGEPQAVPIDETHPQAPINPYGRSKLMVERVLADYERAYELRHVALRYFNAAGADPDGEIGERHEPETHVIPLAIRGAMGDGYTFTIFGDDFDTRDGTAVRDYVHVMDLADAHCRAVDHLAGGGGSDVFNIGTGTGTTVAEIASAVEKVAQKPVARRIGGRREGDPAILAASSKKAETVLGWRPARSHIDLIIRDAWAWHAQQPRP